MHNLLLPVSATWLHLMNSSVNSAQAYLDFSIIIIQQLFLFSAIYLVYNFKTDFSTFHTELYIQKGSSRSKSGYPFMSRTRMYRSLIPAVPTSRSDLMTFVICDMKLLPKQWRRRMPSNSAILLLHFLLYAIDLSPFRQNYENNRNRQKYHHSLKEHPKFTKIAKFGCEML